MSAEAALRALIEVWPIFSDERGQSCFYCSWFSRDFDAFPQHDQDCVWAKARDALLAAEQEVQG